MKVVRSRLDATGRTSRPIRGALYMPTTTDVFGKARARERVAQLQAAREIDAVPYFRRLESAAGPVVEMEGARGSCSARTTTSG